MLDPVKNGTPDYGNLEHGEMNTTGKAEGNAEANTPNTPNKTEGPTAGKTQRSLTLQRHVGLQKPRRPQKPREARRVALRVTRTTQERRRTLHFLQVLDDIHKTPSFTQQKEPL